MFNEVILYTISKTNDRNIDPLTNIPGKAHKKLESFLVTPKPALDLQYSKISLFSPKY
jgi:hypothetical protein